MISYSAAERQGGFIEFKPMYVSPLPIPATTATQQAPIIKLVDRILSAKEKNAKADVSTLEHEIDILVYALYGLTPAEIKLIEASVKK